MVARKTLPPNNLQELVAWLKANPDKASASTTGTASLARFCGMFFQERTGIPARMITLTELPPLTPARITALADATRESLLNVEKHARARSVVVTAFATGDGVAVTVSDDGVGLPGDTATEPGLGLAAVTDGLARIGGGVTVSTNDDGGVTVNCRIPV